MNIDDFSKHGNIIVRKSRGKNQPTEGLEKHGFSRGTNGCTPVAIARIIANNPNNQSEINDLSPICASYLNTDSTGATPHRHPCGHLDRCDIESTKVKISPRNNMDARFPTVAQLARAFKASENDLDTALLHTRGHTAPIVNNRAYQCGVRHRVKKMAIVGNRDCEYRVCYKSGTWKAFTVN
jgi:hypothetical protein